MLGLDRAASVVGNTRDVHRYIVRASLYLDESITMTEIITKYISGLRFTEPATARAIHRGPESTDNDRTIAIDIIRLQQGPSTEDQNQLTTIEPLPSTSSGYSKGHPQRTRIN